MLLFFGGSKKLPTPIDPPICGTCGNWAVCVGGAYGRFKFIGPKFEGVVGSGVLGFENMDGIITP